MVTGSAIWVTSVRTGAASMLTLSPWKMGVWSSTAAAVGFVPWGEGSQKFESIYREHLCPENGRDANDRMNSGFPKRILRLFPPPRPPTVQGTKIFFFVIYLYEWIWVGFSVICIKKMTEG